MCQRARDKALSSTEDEPLLGVDPDRRYIATLTASGLPMQPRATWPLEAVSLKYKIQHREVKQKG